MAGFLETVPNILAYGLPGLMFLFVFLAFYLLKSEQKNREPRKDILGTIRFFMVANLICAILVGAIDIVEFQGKADHTIKSWRGIWETETPGFQGIRIRFDQANGKVQGTYTYVRAGSRSVEGVVEGDVDGNVMIGTWKENSGSPEPEGLLLFVMAEDGRSFTGRYTRR